MGRRDEAVATLEQAFALAEQANMPHFMTYASVMLAIAQAEPGDAASRDDVRDALRSARQSGDKWIEFEVLMALAELEVGEQGTRLCREALRLAQDAGYAVFAARAATRLSERDDSFLGGEDSVSVEAHRGQPDTDDRKQTAN